MALRFICDRQSGCTGSLTVGASQNHRHKAPIRTHGSAEEVHRCVRNQLIAAGYEMLSSREFRAPEGGILVINKKTKSGTPMYYTKKKTRFRSKYGGVIG